MKRNSILFLRNAIIILFVINVINIILHLFGMYQKPNAYRKPYIAPALDPNYSVLLVNTSGCKIANLLPDTSLYEYFRDVNPIECRDTRQPLFESNYTSIYMNESALSAYGFSNKSSVKCCYMWFNRMPVELGIGLPEEMALYQNECVFFNDSVNSQYEYIEVLCFNLTDYPRENIAFYQRLKHKKHFYIDFFYFVKPPQKVNAHHANDKVNVLIVGIDSLSRINFQRQMPRTFDLLVDLGAIEFFGYHKIGENTLPNIIAMLSGKSFTEFVDSLEGNFLDKSKMIWQDYKAAGYTTAFIEDALVTGLFRFAYKRQGGFMNQPTDYYWSIFYREADKAIGNQKINVINYCFGSRKIHELLIEYTKRFVTVMEENNQPYFGHFWQSILTHNDFRQAQNGDRIYEKLITNFYNKGYLNNTVLIFMSDHGNRIDHFRKTYAGMVEDRLPLLFVRLPDWMTKLHPNLMSSLKLNSRRLITTYDLHETLLQLLKVEPSKLSETSRNVGAQRACSIFSPISENRTCEIAGIPNQWCICQVSPIIQVQNDELIANMAERIIFFINDKILIGFKDCAKLKLDSILYARKSQEKSLAGTLNGPATMFYEDFTLAFRTLPGLAAFEGYVRRTTQKDKIHSLLLSGEIIRINTYNNQSLCVDDEIARKYCYCSNLLH